MLINETLVQLRELNTGKSLTCFKGSTKLTQSQAKIRMT